MSRENRPARARVRADVSRRLTAGTDDLGYVKPSHGPRVRQRDFSRENNARRGPQSRRAPRRERSPYPMMTIVVAVVGLALIAWMLSWEPAKSNDGHAPAPAAARVKMPPDREPTPLFAREGGTDIHLAIDPTQLTALAFHQASGQRALHITSLVPDADMTVAAQLKAVPPLPDGTTAPEGVWNGSALRLWRSNRGGMPDTAVDMGADPGTPVWAPVSGMVTEVRPYLLYDRYEDFEIHIRPTGRSDVDLVMIHVQDVKVKAGDRLKGGVTQIASVRKMSDKIDIQLGGYTANGGDHTHLQINSLTGGEPAAGADGS